MLLLTVKCNHCDDISALSNAATRLRLGVICRSAQASRDTGGMAEKKDHEWWASARRAAWAPCSPKGLRLDQSRRSVARAKVLPVVYWRQGDGLYAAVVDREAISSLQSSLNPPSARASS